MKISGTEQGAKSLLLPRKERTYNSMLSIIKAIKRKKARVQETPLRPAGVGVSFYATVEGCHLWDGDREVFDAVHKIFKELPPQIKHLLAFAPKDGEFVQRAQMWRSILKYTMLSAPLQHEIMHCVYQCYIRIKRPSLSALSSTK